MNISRISRFCCLIFLAALLAAPLVQAREQARPGLAILPFTLNGPDDLAYLREGVRAMLASRIAARAGVFVLGAGEVAKAVGDGDESDPEAVAAELDAALVLNGSITTLGPSVSIDARLFMVEGGVSESFFAVAESQAALIEVIDRLASEISAVISGEKREFGPAEKEPAAARTSSGPAPEPEDQGLHPDRIFKKPVAVPAPAEEAAEIPATPPVPPAPPAAPIEPSLSAGRSHFLDMEIQVIDAGDLFGDGSEQIVVAEKQKITVFRRRGNQLLKVIEVPEAPRYVRIIALNLADLNENGRDEIYVSAVSDNTPYSYAVEWGSQGFAKRFDQRGHYLRPILGPDGEWGLYGQQAGLEGPLMPGIYKADPRTGDLNGDDRLDLPDPVNLYDFVFGDFNGDGSPETAVQTGDNNLLLYNRDGDVLWRGPAEYGYTRRFIGEAYSGGKAEIVQVGTRLVALDLNGDGRPELVAMENPSGVAGLIKTVGGFVGGAVKVMTWDGVTFTELWSTGEIGSYMASFQVGDGSLHIGLVAKRSDGLFKGLHSFVASYSLAGIAGGQVQGSRD